MNAVRKLPWLALLLASLMLALGAAACGGDDEGGDTSAAADTAGDTGTPTGIVFNSTNVGGTGDFAVTGKPSFFIFATEDGLIAAWAPGVAPTNAIRP